MSEASAEALQQRLGISSQAAQLFAAADVVDLHVESYSFYRALGYHPHRRHDPRLWGAFLVGQADLPRLRATGITGSAWVITANPLRPEADRADRFAALVEELKGLLNHRAAGAMVVQDVDGYRRARSEGKHACFLAVQGAHAFPRDASVLTRYAPQLLRITLVHMNDTAWGATSAPSAHFRGTHLGAVGYDFVEEMNTLRIGVDLAHLHPDGFWDVVRIHKKDLPLLVTHTGVSGAFRHWRNLDDAQLRAIADTGGVIGIMFHAMYLGDPLLGGRISSVVRHIVHALSVVGEDHVSLGSDWDGLICTPRDMPTCSELPLLADALLRAGVSEGALLKILGLNALRVIGTLKGAAS